MSRDEEQPRDALGEPGAPLGAVPGAPSAGAEAFALVFPHRSMLHAFLSAMLRDPPLVEDTLQDAVIELVESFARYDRALPFGPWARGVARRVALANLRKRGRLAVGLSGDALQAFEQALDGLDDQGALESRKERLRACLERLSASNRDLVHLRYFEELRPEAIAARLGRSVGAIYTAMSRVHAALLRCVQAEEGS
jgi:RNA polymerase sigma-70 factor (ECF subfamily)